MNPVRLIGNARERGRAQAAAEPEMVAAVRAAVDLRMGQAQEAGHLDGKAEDWLGEARAVCAEHVPESLQELEGIAEGFGLTPDTVFTYHHLGILADLARSAAPHVDGCSAWAVASGPDGPLLAKNRDYHGEHAALQRVFLSADAGWGGRTVMGVGSLGSPAAYSSGMNSDGLAIADTQIGTTDHRPGVLRYFVMTKLLSDCADVGEALALIAGLPHAGGGTLVMADRAGAVAAIEFGASRLAVETGGALAMRTNHFISQELADATLYSDGNRIASTHARLKFLRASLPGRAWTIEDAEALMGAHDGEAALCRHGIDGDALTISSAVFSCADGTLYFSSESPCHGNFRRYELPGDRAMMSAVG